ncbi:nSTAND3 domain-containing NTPase [Kangiella sediminilitoris]|uniref:DNA replication protein n=1 Tax=Kangiella sediminilitoris TaxID=1144748 RepID=A0A1B3B910_9GAMM|nr:DNA replication protein [Kangiella sediminilitoris]AOE49260.1 DNA replication protein [Kangiella sediminilitoris]
MASQNQIKIKICELEGGGFQRLCDDWLYKKGYENINSIGMMKATDRVTIGTPDSLLMQENGKYIFGEYTVRQQGLGRKIEGDIGNCLDENKTGIPIDKISKIIICYTGELSTKEIENLRSLCYEKGVILELYGIDTISLSITNSYPALSERHLGIPLDTGQLLSVQDFIERYGKSNFTAPIDNELLFKDDLLKKATELLEEKKFLLISGGQGVGKTLFGVNLVKDIKKREGKLKAFCLFDKGVDLIRDITACFSEPGNYLIFVDDANRLDNRLDYILHYLNDIDEQRSFRIIATVRDYARESVIERVSKITEFHEQTIQPLLDEHIKVLTETLFGIKNAEYQKQIQEVARGNPRLAVMASRVAVERKEIQSIHNAAAIYKEYFGSNDSVKQLLNNRDLTLVACAVSFFRKLDKHNKKQNEWVEKVFCIQYEKFWELIGVLHRNEIVDLYENEVVKISDQVLSTYIFYIAVFERKDVPFLSIVENFFPDLNSYIVDSINPLMKVFNQGEIISEIRRSIKEYYKSIYNTSSSDEVLRFLNMFWFALPEESLLYVKNCIQGMQNDEVNWRNVNFEESSNELSKFPIVKLLSNFRQFDESTFKNSIELLFDYLLRDSFSLGAVIQVLVHNYNFRPKDRRYGYNIQNFIIDRLVALSDRGKNYLYSKLLLIVSDSYLKTEHRAHEWSNSDSINFITFCLPPDEYLIPLREKIIINISKLLGDCKFEESILRIFDKYILRLRVEGKELAEVDFPLIEKYFIQKLDRNKVLHCFIVHKYLDQLESIELSFDKQLRVFYQNKTVELSKLLLDNRSERVALEMGFEDYEVYKRAKLEKYFAQTTKVDFINFLEECKSLYEILEGRERDYLLKNSLATCFDALASVKREIFPQLVSIYLEYDNILEVKPSTIVRNLFNFLSNKEVYALLDSRNYKRKKLWISVYYEYLPEKYIDKSNTDMLLEHISTASSNELFTRLECIDKYKSADPKLYCKVIRVLVDKSKKDIFFAWPMGYIFSKSSPLFGKWFDQISYDKDLVFEAYLQTFLTDNYFDHSGAALKLLLFERFDFLYSLIDKIYEKESYPDLYSITPTLDFLWERDSYYEDITDYAKYLLSKDDNSYHDRESMFCKLFTNERGISERKEILIKKEIFLRNAVKDNATDIKLSCFLFNAASYLGEKFWRELLEIFLCRNTNIDDFKTLNYELTNMSWSSSRVPILERQLKFLESLLPLFGSVELLEHRTFVRSEIEFIAQEIKAEKRRDYIGIY